MPNKIKMTLVAAVLMSCMTCATTIAQTPTLRFGTNNVIDLLADTADQTVDIYAMNVANMNFEGFTLWMQIGDGDEFAGGTDIGQP